MENLFFFNRSKTLPDQERVCRKKNVKVKLRVQRPSLRRDRAPKAERSDARGDSMFFPLLLATKRKLEKEARAARMSSLSIV